MGTTASATARLREAARRERRLAVIHLDDPEYIRSMKRSRDSLI
jgi:hypothetical protein